MNNMHRAIPEEKLTEAYRLLLEMRDNCVKHADDQYDDPMREAKYEALNIAMVAMGRSIPPRWIPVEERLPEELTDVLTKCGHGAAWFYGLAHLFEGKWKVDGIGGSVDIVTHWMPLPEPPEEVQG